MPRLQIILAIHNHQPVGNFGHVFAEAYDRCYRPFLDAIAAHPNVRFALHYTGPLLEWILENRPAMLADLRDLAARGQIELLGGGFYEPMLAVLPDRDARGQIARMAQFCDGHFGQRPAGMWLAERVWDPDLPRVIAPTGMRFTLLDDSHFFAAGLPAQRLWGHYVTEKAGVPIAIFPIDKGLRYAIPFKPIPDLARELEETARSVPAGAPLPCLTYGDDGEKFGVWPGTADWVYGHGWLEGFLRLLEDRGDLVGTVLPSRALEAPAAGRVYLPTASYEEMGEWAMPPESIHRYGELVEKLKRENVYERYRAFVRGGIWQAFFAKYPESNHIHKRMLAASTRVEEAEERGADVTDARTHLYRSQCNCAYWHGLFGGLYLNTLRHALTSNVLRVEALLDRDEHGERDVLSAERVDFDADMREEILVRNRKLVAAIDPDDGGGLVELSNLAAAYCVTDVLARREEGYHDKLRAMAGAGPSGGPSGGGPASIHDLALAKEPGLERWLVVDGYRRASFLDRFHAPGFTPPEIAPGGEGDLGGFVATRYRLAALEADAGAASVTLVAQGPVGDLPVALEKRFSFTRAEARMGVAYRIENRATRPLSALFSPELNLTLLGGDDPDRFYVLPDGATPRLVHRGALPAMTRLRLTERWARFHLDIEAGRPFTAWVYPVETISQSEGGFERTYQGSCLLLRTPIEIAPGASLDLSFSVGFTPA